MSERETPSEIQQPTIQRNAISPPAHSVTTVYVTVNVAEITVTLGRFRVLINPETNIPLPNMMIEWFQSLSLNPIVSKQMLSGITRALEVYERQFGKIPEDPNFQLAPISEGTGAP